MVSAILPKIHYNSVKYGTRTATQQREAGQNVNTHMASRGTEHGKGGTKHVTLKQVVSV